RSLLTYQAVSTAVSILYLGALAAVAGWMAMHGTITPGQLITVVGLAQFLQASLDHIGTFGANWAHSCSPAAFDTTSPSSDPILLDSCATVVDLTA
ncbi:hypothetical protein CJ199_16715, partial [Brevibacterium paucivorans]